MKQKIDGLVAEHNIWHSRARGGFTTVTDEMKKVTNTTGNGNEGEYKITLGDDGSINDIVLASGDGNAL